MHSPISTAAYSVQAGDPWLCHSLPPPIGHETGRLMHIYKNTSILASSFPSAEYAWLAGVSLPESELSCCVGVMHRLATRGRQCAMDHTSGAYVQSEHFSNTSMECSCAEINNHISRLSTHGHQTKVNSSLINVHLVLLRESHLSNQIGTKAHFV